MMAWIWTIMTLCLFSMTGTHTMFNDIDCPNLCVCREHDMTCKETIPITIPVDMTNVYIHNVDYGKYGDSCPFQNATWKRIRQLSILPDQSQEVSESESRAKFILKANTFLNMNKLVYLHFSSKRLIRTEKDAFTGLKNLESLNLNDNVELSITAITECLTDAKLPKLKELSLRRVALHMTEGKYFNNMFFKALQYKPIQHLDLSETKECTMDYVAFANALPCLQNLDVSNGGYLAIHFLLSYRLKSNGSTFHNLNKINLNYPVIPEVALSSGNTEDLSRLEGLIAWNFTDISARAFVPTGDRIKVYGVHNDSNTSVCITLELVLSKINWSILCLPLIDNNAVMLHTLDLAENAIEYMDPVLTSVAIYLRYINLSSNRLFMMRPIEFEHALQNTVHLEEVYLSKNNLKSVSKNLFKYATKIRVIDFSHNRLDTISFDLDHLLHLGRLNLRYNNIRVLDASITKTLDKLAILQRQIIKNTLGNTTANRTTFVKIYLEENPLECSCETKHFISWLTKQYNFNNSNALKCYFENGHKALIGDNTLSETEYLCKIPVIISLITIFSTLIIITITIMIVVKVRRVMRKRKAEHEDAVIEMMNMERKKTTFPVFLSYSGSDTDFVMTHVFPEMNNRFKAKLGTKETCVATGDFNFKPGFPLAEEIINCIENSAVVIFCVSEQFCKSRWCKDELLAAHYEEKPILLMFLEEVDVNIMPKLLVKQLKSTTHSKWVKDENGEFRLTPDWDILCEAIIELICVKQE